MPSGMGYGAQAGLQDVLKQLFLEAQFKQEQKRQEQINALAQQRLAEDARQFDANNVINQGNLKLRGDEFNRVMGRDKMADQRYDDEAPTRAANLAYIGAQTANLNRKPQEDEAERTFQTERDRTLHGYRLGEISATGANRQERMVQVMGPQGTPIYVPESQAAGMPAAQAPRAVTGQERQALAYYNRAKQASDDIAPLEDGIAKAGIASQLQLQHAPNMLQTQQQQSYRQAQRAFTEARLRKESGAAIPQGEYENDARTYFAQPGDTSETIAQKRKARAVVLEGLKFGSGKAFNEFYGETAGTPPSSGTTQQETKEQRMQRLLKQSGG